MRLKIKDKEYEVEIKELREKKVRIVIDGEEFLFTENEEKEKVTIPKTSLPKRNFSEKVIKAPIGGVISEVFVKVGEFVEEGKKLFLLTSMKMENEIVSDFEGKVKKIFVEKNQRVKEGDPLLILK